MSALDRKESPSSERKDADILNELEDQHEGHVNKNARIAALEKTPPEILALSPEEKADLEKKLVRRIDLTVLPILMIMYILNYLDRNNIAAARLYGIVKDTGLVGSEYQSVISVLFASYIFFQVPSNIIASKLRYPGIYINVMMAGWGIVSACTAAANNFHGLVVVRIFLGIFEAAFFPGAVFLLSCWYTKKELGLRTAILFSGSQLGNAFGTLIARGILTMDGVHGIAGWRWLFIIEGVATIGLAIVFGILLPNLPQTSWNWQFSKLQRDYATYRLEIEAGDTEESVGGWEGFRMAVTDIKTYFLMGILSLTYVAGAVNSFFPSVVATLGFSSNNTLLLTAPPFLFCTLCMFFNGWHADRTNERALHVAIPLLITIVSMIMAISSTAVGVRYTAMMLMPGSFYSAAIVTLTWISQSMPRPAQKRAVALAFINSFANTPNIWCSYLYQSSMAPRYLEAFVTNIIACGIAIALTFGLRWYLKRENARMDRGEAVKDITPEMVAIGFRYKY